MKHVWLCDFCTETNNDSTVIENHEKVCYNNPLVKDCGTCNNHERVPYEHAWRCKFGCDFEDEKVLPCEKWELDKS